MQELNHHPKGEIETESYCIVLYCISRPSMYVSVCEFYICKPNRHACGATVHHRGGKVTNHK